MEIILSAEADSNLQHILRYLAARDRAAAVALASLFNAKLRI
jgi:plasmid stabilization system protein ParE